MKVVAGAISAAELTRNRALSVLALVIYVSLISEQCGARKTSYREGLFNSHRDPTAPRTSEYLSVWQPQTSQTTRLI